MKTAAEFRAMIGDRRTNAFLAAADLGITGHFVAHYFQATWREGELVTIERATCLCETLRAAIDSFENCECSEVTLVKIFPAP